MKHLIVGLGNPEPKYFKTRHNSGFLALEHIEGLDFKKEKYGWVARKGDTIFLKPDTYMNSSGEAVHYWMAREKVPLEGVLIVVDDLSLPLGTIKAKHGGSAGGHNGLKSIETCLGNNKYSRLKIGLGNNYVKGEQLEFVLGEFPEEELKEINFERIVQMIFSFIYNGIEKTMNDFNGIS